MNNQPTAAPRNDSFDVLTVYNPSNEPFPVYYNSELHAVIQPHKAIQLVKLIAGDDQHGNIKHLIDRMCRLNKKQKNDPVVRSAWLSKILVSQHVNHLPKIPDLIDLAKQANQSLAKNPVYDPSIPETPSLSPTPPVASTLPSQTAALPPDAQEYINMGYKFHPVTGQPLFAPSAPPVTPESVDTSHVEIQLTPGVPSAAIPGVVPPSPVIPSTGHQQTDTLLAGIRGEHSSDDGERVIGEVTDTPETPVTFTKNWPDNPTKEDLLRYAQTVTMLNIEDPKTKLQLEAQSIDELKATLKYDVFA